MLKIKYIYISELKEVFRYKATIFWNFIFPIILLITLGTIFQDGEKSYISFLLPGIIGVSIVSMSLFSVGTNLASYREQNVLKRFALLPISKIHYLFGHILARGTILIFESIFLIYLSNILFGITVRGSFFAIFILLIVAIMVFSSIGVAIASVSKRAENASAIANLLFFPMVFFSGAYIPLKQLPSVLQPLIFFLPLTHFMKPFRGLFLNNDSLFMYKINIFILCIWFLFSILVSKKYFKWSEEI